MIATLPRAAGLSSGDSHKANGRGQSGVTAKQSGTRDPISTGRRARSAREQNSGGVGLDVHYAALEQLFLLGLHAQKLESGFILRELVLAELAHPGHAHVDAE